MLKLFTWLREETGQTMAEYGLILALVAVVVITAITLLGGNISAFFTDLAGNF
jgi:pilus assembly protein Flp/PilA